MITFSTSESKFNQGEAGLVIEHVKHLINIGLREQDIAVITPYNSQVELIKSTLNTSLPQIEVRSVDGFQVSNEEVLDLKPSILIYGEGVRERSCCHVTSQIKQQRRSRFSR